MPEKVFGMYAGKEETVRIECDNSLAGVVIDRFGKDVTMIPIDDKHFYVSVDVAVSRQCFGLGHRTGRGREACVSGQCGGIDE